MLNPDQTAPCDQIGRINRQIGRIAEADGEWRARFESCSTIEINKILGYKLLRVKVPFVKKGQNSRSRFPPWIFALLFFKQFIFNMKETTHICIVSMPIIVMTIIYNVFSS